MNEQRKVIYRRRDEILTGTDLRESGLEALRVAVEAALGTFCAADHPEEWDLDGLRAEIVGYWPIGLGTDELGRVRSADDLSELLGADGLRAYEARETELGTDTLREVERQVMLRIIDQRWREHLYEMDHLREGIHLRALGQRDPSTEWQREGYALFEELTDLLHRDFLRYVMRVQVTSEERVLQPAELVTSGPEGPVEGAAAMAMAAGVPEPVKESAPAPKEQKVNTQWEATPRNAACPCQSGRKFKHCHGR